MKVTNEQLKQIIKEELNNVLQEWNPLMAIPFMRRNKEEPTSQQQPRRTQTKRPLSSTISPKLKKTYRQLKSAAEGQGAVDKSWLVSELESQGVPNAMAHNVATELMHVGLISYDDMMQVTFEL